MPDEDDLVFYNAVPTGPDPSQAPDGQDALYLLSVAVPFAPREGWAELKDRAAKSIVRKASQFYGDVEAIEIGRQVYTHEDLATIFRRPDTGLPGYHGARAAIAGTKRRAHRRTARPA
jgi:phytoene dehydrogenase-like protein